MNLSIHGDTVASGHCAGGRFSGYASVFHSVDDANDIILPGAFALSLKNWGVRPVPLLWQHDPDQPIGRVETLFEDHHGLYVSGQIDGVDDCGRDALALMRSGALDGLSIGFRAQIVHRDTLTGRRIIRAADLLEVSLVMFPMQRLARVHRVSATDPESPTDPIGLGQDAPASAPVMRGLNRLHEAMIS